MNPAAHRLKWGFPLSFRCLHQPRRSLQLEYRNSVPHGRVLHSECQEFINQPQQSQCFSDLSSIAQNINRRRGGKTCLNLRASIRAEDDTKTVKPSSHIDLTESPSIDVVEDEGLLQAEETEKQIEKYLVAGLAGIAAVIFASYCIGTGQSPDQVIASLGSIDPKKVFDSLPPIAPVPDLSIVTSALHPFPFLTIACITINSILRPSLAPSDFP